MGLDIACVCWSCLAGSWNKPWIFDFGSGKSNLAVNSHELSEELCDFIVGSAVTRHVLRFEFADPDHLHRDPVTAFEWSPWPCPLGHWVTGLWEGNSQTRYATCLRGMVWRDIECTPRFRENDCTGCVRLRKVFTLLSTSKQTAYFKNSLNQLNHTPYFKSMCSQFRCNCENMLYHATKNSRPPHIFKQAVLRPWKQGVGSSTEINATGKCDKKRYEKMTVCKNPWHGFLQDRQDWESWPPGSWKLHGKTSVKMGARFHWFIY